MKDRLEEFIKANREGFDVYEPGENIWKGIQKRRTARIMVSHSLLVQLTRVAAVLLIFAASWALHDYFDYRHRIALENQENQIYSEIPELRETENYYNSLVSVKMKELQPYFRQVPGLDKEVKGDLTQLDSVYVSLKKDLRDNIANDEVIEAMIQNYRMKLEILEDLLNELKMEKNPVKHETKGSSSI